MATRSTAAHRGGAEREGTQFRSASADTARTETGWFIYGLVPGDVETTPQARGLGDPPSSVLVVAHDEVGALVSQVPLDAQLGRPDHLFAYKELLDATATEVPVLPVRFGTVLNSREAVVELLADQHDGYLAALDRLDGLVEYVVRARYVERALLTEVLADNPQAARLQDELRGQPPEVGRDLRIRLGEIVSQAVEARRAADTERLIDALGRWCVASTAQAPTHEQDAANVAFLVPQERRAKFEKAVTRLADDWSERANVRLLGPMAAYDFAADPPERG